jgi:multidrug transporter EmrE-like cation transporter
MSAVDQPSNPRLLAWRLLWLVLPLFGAGYQIAAKSAALDLPAGGLSLAWVMALARNSWTWTMLACEVGSFVTWMTILSRTKLAEAFPLSAVSYVLVIASGWTLFNEPVTALEAVGGGLILAGVWMIASGAKAQP